MRICFLLMQWPLKKIDMSAIQVPLISCTQKIVIYETKAVSFLSESIYLDFWARSKSEI